MLGFAPLIQLVINVTLVALQASGILTPALSQLISSLELQIAPLLQQLIVGNTSVTADILTSLRSLSGVLATLQQQTSLDPLTLQRIKLLSDSVNQAIVDVQTAQAAGVDLSTLTPLPRVAE